MEKEIVTWDEGSNWWVFDCCAYYILYVYNSFLKEFIFNSNITT